MHNNNNNELKTLKQKKKLNSNSENSQIDYTKEFDEVGHDGLMTSKQSVFDFDPSELAANLVKCKIMKII
ncbi:12794_t:CDS:2 [Gigaspora rosea]|nr:12794_t:CDS:2 [Gigaspora rosea]